MGKNLISQRIVIKELTQFFLLFTITAFGSGIADAQNSDLNNFIGRYGNLAISNCSLCHPGYNTKLFNEYATAYRANGRSTAALALIESHDSDQDNFTNIVEIKAQTYPGDATSVPDVVANVPPEAYAGPDQDVNAGASVTLDGSGSSDSDGTIVGYSWTQTDGTTVALTNASTAKPTFTAPNISETLTFELTVTDDAGATATDFVYVNVFQANKPPVANAGPDQTVDEGLTVTLNGSNSSDPDDGIASYQWVQTEGTAVSLSDPAADKPTFVSPDVGQDGAALIFELTVTDKSNRTSTDTCIVNVSWINEAPTADAGPDQSVNEGTTVKLNGINSSDPDDGLQSYAWKQVQADGIVVSLTDATTVEASFTAPAVAATAAKLTFELTVTDMGGLKATDTCIVNVGSTNAVPTAEAGPNQTVNSGDSVTLDGSASSDPENAITGFSWRQINGPSVTLSDPNISNPTFQAPEPGPGVDGASMTFELTVSDSGGLEATDTCIVNIAGANQPPVADAGSDQSVTAGTQVTLDGSGSVDPDGGITEYMWTQPEGPAVKLSDANVMNPKFLAPDVGSDGAKLSFQLTVKDAGGLQSSATSVVNVEPVNTPPDSPNQPPQADAGPDVTVNAGDLVTLDGSNSSDPDDGIAGYLWKQIDGPQVVLNNPPPEKPTFIAPQVPEGRADLTFELTVTDSAGQPASDTCVVTVLSEVNPSDPGQPPTESSIDGVLARIRLLLEDPGMPEAVRERLERVESWLERASGYWQNGRSERALRIVKRCAKNLRIAAKMTNGAPELQETLSAIMVDLKNRALSRPAAAAPNREDRSVEDSSMHGDDHEAEDENEDDDDDERSERNARTSWRSYLSGFFRR